VIDAHILAQWNVIRVMQALDAHAEWSLEQRIALYQNWLAAAPHDDAYAAHFNLAVLFHNAGQAAEAEREYRAALALTDLPQARFNLGYLLEQTERLDAALAEWQSLVSASDAPASALQAQAMAASIRVARRLGRIRLLQRLLAQSLMLDPAQPAVRAELAALRGERVDLPAVPGADDAVIYVLAVCFNEARMLPYFLDHYINFLGAKKIILHDGGSTDGTAEIAARYPQVELIVKVSEKLDDRELMAIRNEEWKKYRDECDWMIVCDVDELLYGPHLRTTLAGFKRDGVTLPMVEGFEMRNKVTPPHQPGRYLWEINQMGKASPQYNNKNIIFDPSIDINYLLGCHSCAPTGPVKRSDGYEFKMLHYCMLSYEAVVQKSMRSAARLSDWNKETNAGFHYRINAMMARSDYNRWFAAVANVLAPRERPSAQRTVIEPLLQYLIMLDEDAAMAELGAAPGFERGGDSGSTEQLAWYAHTFGGSLTTLEPNPLLRRHVTYSLALRGLGRNVRLAQSTVELPAELDLLFCNAADYLGDADDRRHHHQAALDAFIAVEPHLKDSALVVLDGIEDASFGGKFLELVPYLQARGFMARNSGSTVVFSRQPLNV
jgi:hypothetical protein